MAKTFLNGFEKTFMSWFVNDIAKTFVNGLIPPGRATLPRARRTWDII
ncbi:hypothetical protein [Blastochloris sulfoviridis]|nr:hypothetical protein [Blastochloris sulfoviridis]